MCYQSSTGEFASSRQLQNSSHVPLQQLPRYGHVRAHVTHHCRMAFRYCSLGITQFLLVCSCTQFSVSGCYCQLVFFGKTIARQCFVNKSVFKLQGVTRVLFWTKAWIFQTIHGSCSLFAFGASVKIIQIPDIFCESIARIMETNHGVLRFADRLKIRHGDQSMARHAGIHGLLPPWGHRRSSGDRWLGTCW